jgi:uncharacterized protein YbaP (TraB family)
MIFMTAVLSVAPALAGEAAAAPPIWHVRSGSAVITLFGSVHLLSAATQWRTPAFDADLAAADEVWFEIPFDSASQMAASQMALQRGLLPAGQTLSSLLTPSQNQELTALEGKEGISPATLERFRPWLADTTLSILYFEKQGASPAAGVEQQISATLPADRRRGAFETAQQQIGFFADLPQSDQIASLNETLEEIEDDPGAFERLTAAWAKGDVAAIDKEAVQPVRLQSPGAYQRLVVDRNRRWVDTLVQLLKGNKRIFVVVGVGHLVGADGVPALLRARGVEVDGP